MQQYLPFTVLKRSLISYLSTNSIAVATVLTVYGIETAYIQIHLQEVYHVATVLTVYGIETFDKKKFPVNLLVCVATVLTVYGIETKYDANSAWVEWELQQYLPFTVLKRKKMSASMWRNLSCNSTYRLRY